MRRILDGLYQASGVMAAIFLAAIALIVLMQVGANGIDALARWLIGRPIGLLVPSYADFAGYFLATASFLALAHTLKKQAHIRVCLVVERLGPRWRRGAELWASGFGAAITAYFSWYMAGLVHQSWRFADLSPGLVPVPLWIPQAAMTTGLIILTIGLADVFVTVIRGGNPYDAPGTADMAAEER